MSIESRGSFFHFAAKFVLCGLSLTIAFLFPIGSGDVSTDSEQVSSLNASNVLLASQPAKNSFKQNGMNFLAPVSMELAGVELLPFLERYSQLYEFPFFIDRRVDPSILLFGSFTDVTLITALDQMFAEVDLSYCIVDNVFLYVGPKEAAGEALLLFNLKREEIVESFPRQIGEKLNARISFEFKPYEEPRNSFSSLAKRARLKFSGFDKTPFDRWRGASFDDVVVADLLTIMGLGFNVDYRYDAATGTIKPTALNREQKAVRYYERVYGLQIDKEKYKNCSFVETTFNGEPAIRVAGIFRELASVEYEYALIRSKAWSELARQAQDPNMTSKTPRSKRVKDSPEKSSHIEVSGAITNKTLRDLFSYLKKNSKITCELDPSFETKGITLDTRITCEFNQSDVKEIASIISVQIGAVAKVEGARITFSPK